MSQQIAYTLDQAATQVQQSTDTLRRAIKATAYVDAQGEPVFPPPLKGAKRDSKKYLIPHDALMEWVSRLPDA